MLFARVVETSERVTGTSKRLEKIELLATLLKQLNGDECEIAVVFLCGYTRQGRIGVGYAGDPRFRAPGANTAGLEIVDVDRAFTALAEIKGRGADGQRRELLRALWRAATAPEQRFLTALLFGEIRQGALEGVMVEALARASGAGAAEVRRAVMMAGVSPRGAIGAPGRSRRPRAVHRPALPHRCSPCWRKLPRMSKAHSAIWGKRRWKSNSTAPACRSTGRVMTW